MTEDWLGSVINYDNDYNAGYRKGWEAAKADSHNHKVVVEYDLAPALIESRLHDKLLELGYVLTKRTTE